MTRTEYETKRKTLINEAETLIGEGKVEEANKMMDNVTELDQNFEAAAKAAANLKALAHPPVPLAGVGEGATFNSCNQAEAEDMYDSIEYRKAFMNYVLNGTTIPTKFVNAAATTKTTDVGSVISPTVLNRIVEKMETTGTILPLVTKTAFAAGVTVPTSSVKPEATWVAEGAGSDTQKKQPGRLTLRDTN